MVSVTKSNGHDEAPLVSHQKVSISHSCICSLPNSAHRVNNNISIVFEQARTERRLTAVGLDNSKAWGKRGTRAGNLRGGYL